MEIGFFLCKVKFLIIVGFLLGKINWVCDLGIMLFISDDSLLFDIDNE